MCPDVEHQQEVVFSVTRERSAQSLYREYRSLEAVQWESDMTYLRIQKSRYEELLKQLNKQGKQFTDDEFPPSEKSIGMPPSRAKRIAWKRVRDIIPNPIFFDAGADSPETPIGSSNDCYLLPTITTLFQRGAETLQRLFGSCEISMHGIYMMRVNYGGIPQEVVVDDLFPVYEDTNKLVFAKPRNSNEIWEMVVEKVWAKLRGSYSNIQSGIPHEVMTTFSHAPCFFLDLNSQDEGFVWLQLQDACHYKFPTVASSRKDIHIECGIRPLQTYTVLGSYELQAHGKVVGRVIKLVSPTESDVFEGQCHPKNTQFWSQVNPSAKRQMGYEQTFDNPNQFFVSFKEFRKYFDSVDLCHLHPTYNYNFERGSSLTGSLFFEVELLEDGQVYFTLHQKQLKSSASNMAVYGRMIVLVARVVGEDYQYVIAKMEMNFPNLSIRCPNLTQGRYIVYTKCYRKEECHDLSSVLAIYSKSRVTVKRRLKQLCQSFFQRVFLNHAYSNPNKTYLNNSRTDWICAKMLYNEGGFGYIAAHVEPPTSKKIRIEFSSRSFENAGFKIKEPYNMTEVGRIIAEAGRPCIIVCRLLHHIPNKLVFPPDITIEQTI